jgi:hypothetical protein
MENVKIGSKDILVFSSPENLSKPAYERLKSEIRNEIGESAAIVILEGGLSLSYIITKGEPDD